MKGGQEGLRKIHSNGKYDQGNGIPLKNNQGSETPKNQILTILNEKSLSSNLQHLLKFLVLDGKLNIQ